MTLLWMFFLGAFLPEIIMQSPASLVKPGESFTLTVQVKGTSKNGALLLPEGWKQINSFLMENKEGYTRFFTLSTDAQISAGKYTLRYQLSDLSAADSLQLEVQAFSKIEIAQIDLPDIARENDSLSVSYFIENKGNTPEVIFYSSCAGPGDSLLLLPGQSRLLSWKEIVPSGVESYLHQMEVLLDGKYERYYKNMSVFLSKPPILNKEDSWPLEVGLRWLGSIPGGSSYQFFAVGSGNMGVQSFDINLRGPNRLNFPMFGFYDQYYLGYSYNKRWGAELGDFSLSFSPLVELGRFGRGAQIWAKTGASQFKIFYHQPRFFSNQKNSWGAEWAWRKKNTAFSFLSYNKSMAFKEGWNDVNIASGNINFNFKFIELEQDVAVSNSVRGLGLGLHSRLSLSVQKWDLHYHGIYSDQHFYGFYNHSKLSNAQLSYKIYKGYQIGVQHYYSHLNAQPDIHQFYISPKHQYWTGYISAFLNSKQNLYLYFQQGERSDTLSPYHYKERFLGLNYQYNGRKFRLSALGRQGSTLNLLLDDQNYENLSVLNLQPSVQLFPGFWLGVLGEYQNTKRFTDQKENLYFWGGSVQYFPNRKWQFYINYRSSLAQDEIFKQQSLLQVLASTNWSNHTFSVQGGKSYFPTPDGKGVESLFFNLSYSYKIGMPTKKRPPMGRVSGQVQGKGVPVNGVLLYLGDRRFMTDASGKFDFGKVKAGEYELLVKSTQTGINHPEKLHVNVASKSKNNYIIPVFKGAVIRGKVSCPEGLQRVWVYLEHQGEVSTVLTKPDGGFSFSGLKKGDYTVYLQLENYQLPDPVTVQLEEGDEVQIPLQVKTKQRTIQFQSSPLQIKR